MTSAALALTGSGSGIGSGSGALTLAVALAGSGAGAGSAAGTLTQAVALSGSGSGVGSGSGTLRSALALMGVGSGAGYGSGILGTLIQGNANVVHVPSRIGYVGNPPPYILKRSADTILVDVDCSAMLGIGEMISSATVTGGALTFGPPAISVSAQTYLRNPTAPAGTVVQFTITGGTIPLGAQYLDIEAHPIITTNFGETLDAALIVRVQDLAPIS
ncbi:MAG: hypothetical protein KGH75_02740 [Rhodospirillales bacterium]|nr:hypothetical protein [Rhodospirillales bacterium]